MIYKINNKNLEVISEIKEFDELIFNRLLQFDIINNKSVENYIKFEKNKVEIKVDEEKFELNNKVEKTDIYPIIMNVISKIIDDESNILMHSVVVSKENEGYLIIGEFGKGKTTLAKEFEKNGYEINSSDQTWLKIADGKLYQEKGSAYGRFEEKPEIIYKNRTIKRVNIKKIIRIMGICDNGDVSIKQIDNYYYRVKNLFHSCNWHSSVPIFTDEVNLFQLKNITEQFLIKLAKTDIEYIDIRGDKKKIVKQIGDML